MMKPSTSALAQKLFERVPALSPCASEIDAALQALLCAFQSGGKVLVCGNGGSAADAEHICGELLKSFRKPRPLAPDVAAKLPAALAAKLEGALPAICLSSMSGIVTAFSNDVGWEYAYAQQVLGLARTGDVLLAISTSGRSANVVAAAQTMRAIGGKVIALTGTRGTSSPLAEASDIAIAVPADTTETVQELHLPVYHTLCAMLEEELF